MKARLQLALLLALLLGVWGSALELEQDVLSAAEEEDVLAEIEMMPPAEADAFARWKRSKMAGKSGDATDLRQTRKEERDARKAKKDEDRGERRNERRDVGKNTTKEERNALREEKKGLYQEYKTQLEEWKVAHKEAKANNVSKEDRPEKPKDPFGKDDKKRQEMDHPSGLSMGQRRQQRIADARSRQFEQHSDL